MAVLQKNSNVNTSGEFSLYEVLVNDGGSDGGTNSRFNITVDMPGNVTNSDLEIAIQAFASSLESVPGFALTSIKKTSLVETTL